MVAVWRENRPYLDFFGATAYDLYEICLIASVKNYSEPYSDGEYFYFQWSNIPNLAIGATARSNTFGASNSVAIINQGLPLGEKAASKCANYINRDLFGLGVYTDWHLPSTFEINCLANNAAIVDRVISQYATDKGLSLTYNDGTGVFSDMDLFVNANAFATGGVVTGYWTSTEYNAGSAYYLNMANAGVIFATASKNSFKFTRPFRQDVRKWDGIGWIPETEIVTQGTTPLAQYEYLLITYVYSFDGIRRDMDSATFLMGTGTAEDGKKVGCGQGGMTTPMRSAYQTTDISTTYLFQNGDDVGNGKGESIVINFQKLRTDGISLNQNITAELYGGWHTNSTWPNAQGNLVSVSIKTYVGGTLTRDVGLNTITSSGTCIQSISYNNFPVSGRPTNSGGVAGCGADPVTQKTRVGTINYNLTTKVSSVTFY